jgi:hypothetical protein
METVCVHKVVVFMLESICVKCGLTIDTNYTTKTFSDTKRTKPIKTNQNADLNDIKRICQSEKISKKTEETIISIWQEYIRKGSKSRKGKIRQGVLSQVFYRGFFLSGNLRTKEEIMDMFKIDLSIFRKGEKIINPLLPTKELENTINVFHSKFCRLVAENNLPFRIVDECNVMYNKNADVLQRFNNQTVINSIFILILFKYTNQDKNVYKKLCIKQNVSVPAFMKIKKVVVLNGFK